MEKARSPFTQQSKGKMASAFEERKNSLIGAAVLVVASLKTT
jgi:hypothetical protein